MCKITEKVERIIENEFPEVLSTTRFHSLSRTPFQNERFERISKFYAFNIRDEYTQFTNPLDYYKALIDTIKKKRTIRYSPDSPIVSMSIANCSEYARLGNLILGLNGFKGRTCPLYNEMQDIDHAITIIVPETQKRFFIERLNKLKDAIILDPWLKFTGHARDYSQACVKDYTKLLFDRSSAIPNPHNIAVADNSLRTVPVTQEVIKYFKTNFPQFFLKDLT